MVFMRKINRNDLIVLVEPQPTDDGILGGSSSFDIYTSYSLTARSINYIGAVAKSAGFTNIKYIDQHHGNINSFKNKLYILFSLKCFLKRIYSSNWILSFNTTSKIKSK